MHSRHRDGIPEPILLAIVAAVNNFLKYNGDSSLTQYNLSCPTGFLEYKIIPKGRGPNLRTGGLGLALVYEACA